MLKLLLSGNPGECYHFLRDLKSQRQYEVELESKEYDASSYQVTNVRLNIDMKPKERKPLVVRFNTETGEQIELNLLDGVVMQLEEGITYVTGKVFDVVGTK